MPSSVSQPSTSRKFVRHELNKQRKCTVVIDHDVAGLARGVGADHARAGNDLADEGVLLLGDVDLNLGLVPVPVMRHDDQHTFRPTKCPFPEASSSNNIACMPRTT